MRAVGLVLWVAAAAGGWQFEGSHRGVAVYTRAAPGSEVRELRAEGVIQAPIAEVRRALVDYERYPGRMPYVKEVRLLRRVADGLVVYQRVSPPMLADRDEVIHVTIAEDLAQSRGRRFVTRWEVARDDDTPPTPGVVRLTQCTGSWELEALSPTQTRVVLRLHVDPGGELPAWTINLANTRSVPELFQTVERLAREGAEG